MRPGDYVQIPPVTTSFSLRHKIPRSKSPCNPQVIREWNWELSLSVSVPPLPNRVSLHSPCCPRTHYLYQNGLGITEICLSLQLMYWEYKGLCHNTWPNNVVFRETLPNDTYWGLGVWLSGRVVSTVYKKLIPFPSQQQQEDTYLNIYGYCEAIFKIQGWR